MSVINFKNVLKNIPIYCYIMTRSLTIEVWEGREQDGAGRDQRVLCT